MPTERRDAAGERAVRRLLLVLFLLGFLLLAAIAVYVFRKVPHIDYSATNRLADLTYIETWLVILAVGAAGCLRRRGLPIAFAVLLLLLAEAGAQAYIYSASGAPYQPEPLPSEQKFEPHPLLVGIPKPGNFAGVVHDSDHSRRTDNPGKASDAKVIFAFGGSTTYDLANNDLQTWPSDLSRQLGPEFLVENLGVPGYTSVETLIQSLFVFRGRPPACAIYFNGMNDLRNVHVEGLLPDYSNFHLPSQRRNLGLDYPGFIINNSAFARVLVSLVSAKRPAVKGVISSEMDPQVAALFKDNIRLTIQVARYFGVKPIFLPSVANWRRLTGDNTLGWFPLIRARDMHGYVDAINAELKQVAAESGASYLDAPLSQQWTDADFKDTDHFSAAGASKFAASIAPAVAALCR
jgi:lysophospholipase L1-like esterase